jgi:ubiquinone/menaquinone biosynthesis C-methylase UbiE
MFKEYPMAQRESGLHGVLSLSWVYDAFQRAVGAERYRRRVVDEIIRPNPGQRIVDIGCGTAEVLKWLPNVHYLGIDPNPHYIQTARRRYSDRGTFLVGSVQELEVLSDCEFDLAIALGLLHHLEDTEVQRLFKRVRDLLSPGGRLITVDCTLIEGQHPLARFVIRQDRGLNVRTSVELVRLVREYFDDPNIKIHHDLLRIPYTHISLECQTCLMEGGESVS